MNLLGVAHDLRLGAAVLVDGAVHLAAARHHEHLVDARVQVVHETCTSQSPCHDVHDTSTIKHVHTL